MYFKKFAAISVLMVLVLSALAGCDGGGSGGGKDQTTTVKGAKEPTIVSMSESIGEAGNYLGITIDYEEEIETSQLKVTVGGISAKINDCYKNKAAIIIPNGVIAGAQTVRVWVNDKECKNPLSIEIRSPVIMGVASYSSGIGIEVINIMREADMVRVFFNDNEIPYEYINPLRPQDSSLKYSNSVDFGGGLYSIMVYLSKEIKDGEVYIMYGENKSNTFSFTRD